MSGQTKSGGGAVRFVNPPGLIRNPAFSQVAVVTGPARTVYVGGQNAVDESRQIVGKGDVRAQCAQIAKNIDVALAAAGASISDVVRWNVHVVQGQDLREGLQAFQEHWGSLGEPPTITVVVVAGLAHPDFLVEVDAIAVMPEG